MARGLQKQLMQIPLSAGLNQKSDNRADQPPAMAALLDARFTELGGLQTRYPFTAMGSNILGGGTIANPRRIVANGKELLLFTVDTLYSWSVRDTAWVPKATHLATSVSERSVFGSNSDQVLCDRAELNGTVVYCWDDPVGSSGAGGTFVAAMDKSTGAVICGPTLINGSALTRLVALQTKILLVTRNGFLSSQLAVLSIDPANVAASLSASLTSVGVTLLGLSLDAVAIPGSDSAAICCTSGSGGSSSYFIATVTAALSISVIQKNRVADGPIAISVTPDATSVQVFRTNGTNLLGDLVGLPALSDVFTGQAIGSGAAASSFNQIACAHRTAKVGGQYRCYVWWDNSESATSLFITGQNSVDVSGSIGTASTFRTALAPASRAFDYNGRVFAWFVFAGDSHFTGFNAVQGAALQNTYFMFRDDGFLVAKATAENAGGFAYSNSYVQGGLPGVALTNGSTTFSWCGQIRRDISTGTPNAGYSGRAPQDITFTFDDNAARRVARIGNTLYLTGGELLGYDGSQLAEVGFHIYPWAFQAVGILTGTMGGGTYGYKQTVRWDNAAGDRDRSTTATIGTVFLGGAGAQGVEISAAASLQVTHKTSPVPTAEFWRTQANAPVGANFYLVTSINPANATNPNRYCSDNSAASTISVFDDALPDASVAVLATNPENGGILENLAPPAATIIAATQNRVFIAGIAGQPNTVWYSKNRNTGEVAAFNDALTFDVPIDGGAITAIDFINETVLIWCESAIYAVDGNGFDNAGGGTNFGQPRILSTDVGAKNAECVAYTPFGFIFKSAKGWYMQPNGSASPHYIGAQVDAYDSEDIQSVIVLETQHEIRCLSNERMLAFDYVAKQWAERTINDGLSATMWMGNYLYLSTTGPKSEQPTYASGVTYGIDGETNWIKANDLQGFARFKQLMIAGEWRGLCGVRVRMAYDYQYASDGVPLWTDDETIIPTQTTVGGTFQFSQGPSQQQCEAVKVRISVVKDKTNAPCITEGVKLIGMAWEYGIDPRPFKRLSVAQKQ